MSYVHEVDVAGGFFVCSKEGCDGVMEASAKGWLNLEKGADGIPLLSVFGFSEDYDVTCSECGSNADDDLEIAVGRIIVGEGTEWFRG